MPRIIPGVACRGVLSCKPADRFRLRPVGEDSQSAIPPEYILNSYIETLEQWFQDLPKLHISIAVLYLAPKMTSGAR